MSCSARAATRPGLLNATAVSLLLLILMILPALCSAQQAQADAAVSAASNGVTITAPTITNGGGRAHACLARPALTCVLAATRSTDSTGEPSLVAGKVDFTPFYSASAGLCRTRITGTITGLAGSRPHAWHIHQKGDISDATGKATGSHYNPFNVRLSLQHTINTLRLCFNYVCFATLYVLNFSRIQTQIPASTVLTFPVPRHHPNYTLYLFIVVGRVE
jgi:Cu/Zn superoxide dismutase